MADNPDSAAPSGWEELLTASRTAAEDAAYATALRRKAGAYLWAGAKALIEDWNCDADPEGDLLYASALAAIGKERKSAVSKIRTVALATRDLDLHLECYGTLNEAYRNARRLAEPPAAPSAVLSPSTSAVSNRFPETREDRR